MLGKQLDSQHPERNPVVPRLVSLAHHVSGPVSPALFVLACAVGVVMLIVCANLSNLQLARFGSAAKGNGACGLRWEPAVSGCCGRCSPRAWRCRVAARCWVWSLALAGTRELAHLHAFNLPLLESVRIDGSALLFTLLAAFASGVLFGLLPALQVTGVSLREGMEDSSRGSSGGKRHAWVRDGLVVSELAFACILLIGAGLLIRSFLRVLDVNLGFRPERAAALRIDPSFRIASFAQQNSFIDDVLNRARSVPGIVGGRNYRRPAAPRRPVVAGFRGGTGLREGPPPAGAIHSRCDRRVFRGCRNSVAIGQRIHGEGSRVQRTRRGGQ